MNSAEIDRRVMANFPTPVAVAWQDVLRSEFHENAFVRFHDVFARTR